MAGEAFRVIECRIMFQIIVRIMTRHTTDPGINFIVSVAIKNAIRLKADVIYSTQPRHQHHLLEALMTDATEFLGQIIGVQTARVKDLKVFEILSFDGSQVFFAGPMTAFTGDARHQMVEPELRACDGGCRVAPETTLRLVESEHAP